MGCGNSNSKVQQGYTGKGYHPKKLTSKDVLWQPNEHQFIVGNGSLLKFDVKSNTLTKVNIPGNIVIGDRCASVFLVREGENETHFMVCGGNNDFKEFYDECYLFYPHDIENPKPFEKLPIKVSHHCLAETPEKKLYLIGGLTYGKEEPFQIVNDIWHRNGQNWQHVGKLPKPRTNFEIVVNKTQLFIFAGSSDMNKGPSTQIDIFDTTTNKVSTASYRLPLGVEGASLAWHGRDVLIIGGVRAGKPSPGVMKLDFKDKTILSVRDLTKPRANPIIVPTKIDQILAIGGSGERTVEMRRWDDKENDYNWFDCTKDIKGLDNLGNPNEYNSVTVTFEISASDDDNFPAFNPKSNFIFGNELSPFLLEFTEEMEVAYYPAPMSLQQKTGQIAFRRDPNTIFFVGGCDATYTYYSKKTFKFDIKGKKVEEVAKLSVGRTGFGVVHYNNMLYVTGGWTKGHKYLKSCEALDMDNPDKPWQPMGDMTVPRAGHFMWVDTDKQILYAAGGISAENGQPLDSVEFYCLSKKEWKLHEKKLNKPLQWAMALPAADGKNIIVIGGATGADPEATATKEAWLINKTEFNGFSAEPAFTMRVARYNPFTILAGHDDMIAIIGGSKERVMEIFSHKDYKADPENKVKICNEVVYESLENYTTDLGLFTCAGC